MRKKTKEQFIIKKNDNPWSTKFKYEHEAIETLSEYLSSLTGEELSSVRKELNSKKIYSIRENVYTIVKQNEK